MVTEPVDGVLIAASTAEADRADPRYECYQEYCEVTRELGRPCISFIDWLIQSEEGY